MLRFATFLVPNGYTAMLIDAREHGKSGSRGWGISYGVREHQDIICSAKYLRRNNPDIKKVVAMGSFTSFLSLLHVSLTRVFTGMSQGGASSILAAALSPEIDAVIAESPFAAVPLLVQGEIHAT